jgi:acyl carrier protein
MNNRLKILNIVKEVCFTNEISLNGFDEKDLNSIADWDSMCQLTLFLYLEEEFGKDFPVGFFEKNNDLDEIEKYFCQ